MTKQVSVTSDSITGGGKRGTIGTQDAPPVSVDENVYVSADKPYTLRMDIATMNEFEAWCKARKLGKGPVIAAALREYMARHGEG